MVCFEGPEEKTLYLFVIDSAIASAGAGTELQEIKGLATASWNRGDKTYLLAADLAPAELRAFL